MLEGGETPTERAHKVLAKVIPTCVGTFADGPEKGQPYHTSICRDVTALIESHDAEMSALRERLNDAEQARHEAETLKIVEV